jgi:Domain of unknown function (DUF4332)
MSNVSASQPASQPADDLRPIDGPRPITKPPSARASSQSGGQSGGQSGALRSQNWPISKLPGLSETDCEQLEAAGITTTFQLLQNHQTVETQTQLAQKLSLPNQHVQKWLALSDLARVPSVGCDYSGLLLHAGVASVRRLSELSPGPLHRQIMKLQVHLIQCPDHCPQVGSVERWIQQARGLGKL